MAQPWFHSKLSRDEAHKLISQHGPIDGYVKLAMFYLIIIDFNMKLKCNILFSVFLLRDSQSNPKTFVLSLCHSQRIRHFQIVPVSTIYNVTSNLIKKGSHIKSNSLQFCFNCTFMLFKMLKWKILYVKVKSQIIMVHKQCRESTLEEMEHNTIGYKSNAKEKLG